jgi:alcohol dehydrogenase class IV
VGVPTSQAQAGISREALAAKLEKLVDDSFNDSQMLTAVRSPSYEELKKLFWYLYEGQEVDF